MSVKKTLLAVAGIALAVATLTSSSAQEADPAARLAALESELAALEHEIELLEDTKAIKSLQRAYGYYAAKKLSDKISALFAADATAEIGGLGVFVGRERIGTLYDLLLDGGLEEGRLLHHMILASGAQLS